MKATVSMGRVAGVPVGLHWSVLGIVWLLVLWLSGWLPAALPGRPGATYFLAAVLAAALFLLSLLAHELAHAVVARRNGIEVEGVTLWLLGGGGAVPRRGTHTRRRLPRRGRRSGGECVAGSGVRRTRVAGRTDGGHRPGSSGAGISGVVLAGFNLIPAAPLDGGRVLRAAIWARRGDRLAAAVWATRTGRVFGFVLIGLGLVRLLTGMGGLWWVLIGLFVVTTAGAEEQLAEPEEPMTALLPRLDGCTDGRALVMSEGHLVVSCRRATSAGR